MKTSFKTSQVRKIMFHSQIGGVKTRTSEIKMTKGRSREMTERKTAGRNSERVRQRRTDGNTLLDVLFMSGAESRPDVDGFQRKEAAGGQMHIHTSVLRSCHRIPPFLRRSLTGPPKVEFRPVPCGTQRPQAKNRCLNVWMI